MTSFGGFGIKTPMAMQTETQAKASGIGARFTDKVVLITGGTRGIGRAVALKMATEGAKLALGFFKSRQKAKETENEVKALGAECVMVRGNLANPESIQKMFGEVQEAYGRLDIFVANAAMAMFGPTLEMSLEDWKLTLDANITSFYLCSKEAAKMMTGPKGRIIALTSYGSKRYIPGYAAMGTNKAAIEALVRYLAVDLAPKGILVNAVNGGPVDTDSLRIIPGNEEIVAESVKRTPAGRIGQPEDLANVVAFLASDEADWIVGQTIIADGGVSLY